MARRRTAWLGPAGLLVVLALACAPRPAQQVADAQPRRNPPGRRSSAKPQDPDPCRAAVQNGRVTRVDRQGRPIKPPVKTGSDLATKRLPPAVWVGTRRQSKVGREISSVELWYLAHPQGGCMELFVDGRLWRRHSTRTLPVGTKRTGRTRRSGRSFRNKKVSLHRFAVDPPPPPPLRGATAPGLQSRRHVVSLTLRLKRGRHRVEVRPVGRGTLRLFGFVLRRKKPGVLVHNLGVIGAQTATVLVGKEKLALHQLGRLKPSLLVLQVGTNDAYDRQLTAARFELRFTRLLRKLKQHAGKPACLVVGAPDFGDRKWRRARRLRGQAAMIRPVQRKVAAREGCAYWDLFAAMGGAGSVRTLMRAKPPFAYRDRVHLTPKGYRALGSLLFDELLRGYARYLKSRPRLRLRVPTRTAEELREDLEARRTWPSGMGRVRFREPPGRPLDRFYRSLVLVARKAATARAPVVYLGDSHVAGDHLTGELRRRLQLLFGDGGHGFVAAGAPWTDFTQQDVRSGARGPWKYYELKTRRSAEQPTDSLFGVGGISTWITLPLPPAPRPPPRP